MYINMESKVIKYPLNGTSAMRYQDDIQETTNKVSLDFQLPKGHTATVIIENKDDEVAEPTLVNKMHNRYYFYRNSNISNSEIINNLYIEEVRAKEAKKRDVMRRVFIRQTKFLLVSLALIIGSLLGLFLFSAFNFTVIHPALYIFMIIMGLGWGVTSIAAILEKKGV